MRWVYNSLCASLSNWKASYVIVITILLFTVAIRLLTVFTDVSSRKSSAKMQAIQPDLQKLQKKYGNDPQKLNVEQKKLMSERGVSMFGGCLPLLFTLPLFFIFINAFRAWSNEQTLNLLLTMSEQGEEAGTALFNSYKFFWINNIWRPDNLSSSVVLSGKEFWQTFASTGKNGITNYIFYEENKAVFDTLLTNMHFFGENLTLAEDSTEFIAAYEAVMKPCIDQFSGRVNGFAVLPIIAGVSTYLQSWLSMKNTPQTDANGNNTGKTMMYMMPLLTVFFCWQYDSTFSIYWIISNIVAIVVAIVLNKKMPAILAKDAEKQALKLAAKETDKQ